MSLRSTLNDLIYGTEKTGSWSPAIRKLSLGDDDPTENFRRRFVGSRRTVYRLPTVREALGVPAIHRAVALISSTTGMLSIQGYRNGEVLEETPRLIARPDPFHTPFQFYSGTAAQMAKYGEWVWFIASRDGDGNPSALVLVPLHELNVQANPSNRMFPTYRWGSYSGTRYSTANPQGNFVHVLYPMSEPFALRGEGPLQLCNAASSVAVEAQYWAANFYGEGGHPSVLIRVNGQLGSYAPGLEVPDENEILEDAETEAEQIRRQWTDRPNNVPRIVDERIKDVEYKDVNPSSTQMLESRNHQAGDASRMFGIAGSLLEYQQGGTSLTYQNLTEEFTKFVKTCLAPLYLEPMEQELSDLLPRSTAARFNVQGFLRADIKTRFEVYQLAIANGIYGPDYAQKQEGIAPGDVEFASILPAPPQAVPGPISTFSRTEPSIVPLRCDGLRLLRGQTHRCGKLLSETGLFIGRCPRCGKDYTRAA